MQLTKEELYLMKIYEESTNDFSLEERMNLIEVNSFATKGKGTWGKADKDLAARVRKEEAEQYGHRVEEKDSPSKRERGTDSLTKKYKEDTPGQNVKEAALDANMYRGDTVKFTHDYVTDDAEELVGTFVGTDPETGRARIRTNDGKLYVIKHENITLETV